MASKTTRSDGDELEEDPDDDFESGDEYEPDDDEVVTGPCPFCRQPIWEEAESCEHCGRYVSASDRNAAKPWWILLGFLLCLAAILLWVLWR